MGLGPALGHITWHEKLRRALAQHRGVRMGESTVVSRNVHMSDPRTPQVITVLTGSDAGDVFYGRPRHGEVIHIDIFHALAEVDHRRTAAALRWALAGVAAPVGAERGGTLLDYFDVMTATGGGRVTGDLSFGKKPSLRAAHRNHVHLAGRLGDDQLHLLVVLIGTVEDDLQAQGVEIRRVDRVCHSPDSGSGTPLDLSHYTDYNDSWIRGSRSDGRTVEAGAGGVVPPRDGGTLRHSRAGGAGPWSGGQATAAGRATAGTGDTPPGVPNEGEGALAAQSEGSPASGWESLEQERRLQAALDLSRRLGSPDEVSRVLDQLQAEQGWASLYGSGSSQAPFVIRQLEDEGLVRRDIRGLRLTREGLDLAAYLKSHLRDVKLRFRKLIRRLPTGSRRQGGRSASTMAPPSADVRYGPVRGAAPAEKGAWLGDVAIPETVRAALRRTHLEQVETRQPAARLRLLRTDVHVHLRSGQQPLNICLLIDASASMAGRRILAAKHLARHLLVSTRDHISVIAFQERDVRVYVPFTRDWGQVEDGLSRIQPLGLTPLAHGLTQSLELIKESRVRRPLLLLITDGIPTVPKWTIDPLADALEAARQVGVGKVPFGCIGLQPSRRYLEDLVKAAGGTLHVVEELNEDVLVSIAHQERLRTSHRAK